MHVNFYFRVYIDGKIRQEVITDCKCIQDFIKEITVISRAWY